MPIAIIDDFPDDGSDCAQAATSYSSPQQAAMMCQAPGSWGTMREQRENDGRCGDCGLQTHEIQVDPLTRYHVKIPLTITWEVHRGRCLLCHPLSSHQLLGHQMTTLPPPPRIEQPLQPESKHSQSSEDSNLSSSHSTDTPVRRVSQHSLQLQSGLLYHDPSDPAVQESLAIIQGNTFDIADILSAMNRVPYDFIVQERGCERLWILSWEDENAAAIGRVGGIRTIVHAMTRFPMNPHLQQCGCESLQNLALNDYNRREICDLSGVPLIVQAMMRHPSVAGIQQCGCTALASIASSADQTNMYRQVIAQAGGLDATLIAARNFCDEESVIQAAYDALQSMGFDLGADGVRFTPASVDSTPVEQPSSDHIVCMDM